MADVGKPLFGTLISLLHNGVPVLGIIDQPVLKVRPGMKAYMPEEVQFATITLHHLLTICQKGALGRRGRPPDDAERAADPDAALR